MLPSPLPPPSFPPPAQQPSRQPVVLPPRPVQRQQLVPAVELALPAAQVPWPAQQLPAEAAHARCSAATPASAAQLAPLGPPLPASHGSGMLGSSAGSGNRGLELGDASERPLALDLLECGFDVALEVARGPFGGGAAGLFSSGDDSDVLLACGDAL